MRDQGLRHIDPCPTIIFWLHTDVEPLADLQSDEELFDSCLKQA